MLVDHTLEILKRRFDAELEKYFDRIIYDVQKKDGFIVEALKYVKKITLAGGKRLRPSFMYYGYLGANGKEKKKMILLKSVFLIDTENSKILKTDILVSENRIKKIADKIKTKNARVIRAEGLWASPALVDIHVHSRVPGKEEAEDFFSLTKAALSGGIGTVVAMPNTEPPTDNPEILKKLIEKAKLESPLNLLFSSAATKGRKGKEMADIKQIAPYVAGFTDDGSWVENTDLMLELLLEAARYGKKIFSHPQIPGRGAINEGAVSKKLGISAMDRKNEYLAVFRDCLLSILTGVPLHLQQISAKESIEIIKEAKKLNPGITAETAPHYFCFTEDKLKELDSDFKMNPPLRTEEDRKSIIRALKEGIIDIIATDHAPHTRREKEKGIEDAPFGVTGLETLLSSSLTELYFKNKMPLENLIQAITSKPARIINLKGRGMLKEGFPADIALIDPKRKWTVDSFYSKSSNSPFKGIELKGKNIITIIDGVVRYENGRFFI